MVIIEGRVVRILSADQLIINVGMENGVNVDMIFTIYGEEGEEIVDPVTKEILGKLEFQKARVVVKTVMPKFSIVASRKRTISPFTSTTISGASLFSTEYEHKLPIDSADIEPPSGGDATIKVGDLVRARA